MRYELKTGNRLLLMKDEVTDVYIRPPVRPFLVVYPKASKSFELEC